MSELAMKKGGSVLGGMLLIAGSCVGAGMLGLPIATGPAGFFPSLLMFVVACLFMTATALLLVEINVWYKRPVNFITMVTDFLGPFGRALCWIIYLFLFYALLVAYIAGSGNHLANICEEYFSFSFPAADCQRRFS
jgi:tyrosine-specific transport protein